jgi:hypothetical protein
MATKDFIVFDSDSHAVEYRMLGSLRRFVGVGQPLRAVREQIAELKLAGLSPSVTMSAPGGSCALMIAHRCLEGMPTAAFEKPLDGVFPRE